ncbi:MAG: NAD(P)/FAD-dependent oxidoreductase [Rubrimonas sp.]|uniref:NAD(P)/FAD-dependent oxidoreductase n=1 Tax=Rubrimonas sp. TaxID=2036015 RepID=UPI002FDD8118
MQFLTANDAPGAHAPSWFRATANSAPTTGPLSGETRADVCVIGGGYAGLSAALHLAQAGRDVVLLEAHRLGWGASGRNGGQLSYGPRIGMDVYERMLGPDDARKIWEISTEATRLTKRLIAEHAIACDLSPGHLEAAAKPGHAEAMRREADHLGKVYGHEGLRWLDRGSLRARVASPLYHGGLDDPEGGHLHPLNYALGLADAARKAGARLHERSVVREIGEGVARTDAGEVRADWVILACNGYLDRLERRVAARMMPINNFIVATEPLGARADALLPRGDCVADSWFVLNYFRLSPDGRLLFGGGETYSHKFPRDIEALVRKPLERVFPQLKGVRIDHAWGGTLSVTANRAPLFWRDGKRLLSIGGWSGAGVHMATMGGAIAAEAVRGTMARWDVLARAASGPFPGGDRFRPALLALAMTWYALRDRL